MPATLNVGPLAVACGSLQGDRRQQLGGDSPQTEKTIAESKHRCDLIMVSSHGRKGIKRLLLGSETQQVLTHAHLPVLPIR